MSSDRQLTEGDERVAVGTQLGDHSRQRVGVERGVVVRVGAHMHEHDLAGPQPCQHPGDNDSGADVAGGALPAKGVDGPADRNVAKLVGDGDRAGVGVAALVPVVPAGDDVVPCPQPALAVTLPVGVYRERAGRLWTR